MYVCLLTNRTQFNYRIDKKMVRWRLWNHFSIFVNLFRVSLVEMLGNTYLEYGHNETFWNNCQRFTKEVIMFLFLLKKKSILLRIILTLLLIQYLFIFCIDSPEHLSHLIFDFAYNYWKLRWLLIYFSRVSSPDDWLNYCEIRSPLIALVECLGV